jgi:hypothetical protein
MPLGLWCARQKCRDTGCAMQRATNNGVRVCIMTKERFGKLLGEIVMLES